MQHTSYSTPTEYFDETTRLDRVFLAKAVKEFESENQKRSTKILNALFGK